MCARAAAHAAHSRHPKTENESEEKVKKGTGKGHRKGTERAQMVQSDKFGKGGAK
jgi:ribosomal protein L19E